ncbi:MAG: hypothetical protein ASARMPRED_001283 [Alectoria sarmentosa]|nr:MAG: hypothetical protein ASARMPRED_001283 [Alectoria sarmentosa]
MVPKLDDCVTKLHRCPEDLEEWTKVMSEKIVLATELYRASVDSLLKSMNKGDGFMKDGTWVERFSSILAEAIYRGDYVRLTEFERGFFIEKISKLEISLPECGDLSFAEKLNVLLAMCNLPGSILAKWRQTRELKMFDLDDLMNKHDTLGTNAEEFLAHS